MPGNGSCHSITAVIWLHHTIGQYYQQVVIAGAGTNLMRLPPAVRMETLLLAQLTLAAQVVPVWP
jgi:hypothetical protein